MRPVMRTFLDARSTQHHGVEGSTSLRSEVMAMESLEQQIEDAYLLMRGARERGDVVAESVHSDRVDRLLARYPHGSRF